MCGIAGFIDRIGGPSSSPYYLSPSELIDRMCQVIRHRGPDDQGTWVGDSVALGMRRLSIIDMSGGHQPVFNEDQSVLIVFNGEIYNYRELQKELRARGHSFRTNSDTETIVHAYEEYGDECVSHLRGMFAFAIWDRNRQRLLAARDRFGNMLLDPATRYLQSIMLFPHQPRSAMYSPEFFAQVCDHNPYERLLSQFPRRGPIDRAPRFSVPDVTAELQYADVRTYLADDILVKVDKASMFNSLETRAPLLDHYLAEYVASLPSTVRMRNGVLKYLLKKVAAGLVSASILTRPKQGFSAPIKHWFRGELIGYAYELLLSPRAQERGIFDPRFIPRLLRTHAETPQVNYSAAIWALLCLERWFQAYMDQQSDHVELSMMESRPLW